MGKSMMDAKRLIELEQKALACVRADDHAGAIVHYESLVALAPRWEHGGALYGLGNAYESVGEFEKAENALRGALEVEPGNWYFVSGLAGFLRDRGRSTEAFEWYVRLHQMERRMKSAKDVATTFDILTKIAAELGPEQAATLERIKAQSDESSG